MEKSLFEFNVLVLVPVFCFVFSCVSDETDVTSCVSVAWTARHVSRSSLCSKLSLKEDELSSAQSTNPAPNCSNCSTRYVVQ